MAGSWQPSGVQRRLAGATKFQINTPTITASPTESNFSAIVNVAPQPMVDTVLPSPPALLPMQSGSGTEILRVEVVWISP
jgi:hypothetical protein